MQSMGSSIPKVTFQVINILKVTRWCPKLLFGVQNCSPVSETTRRVNDTQELITPPLKRIFRLRGGGGGHNSSRSEWSVMYNANISFTI
jgi:hypothetical protein